MALTSGSLGAAKVAVPRCTTSDVTIVANVVLGAVVSTTISGLPSACGGATAQAAVNNGTSSSSGSAAVPAGGGSVTVTLAASITASTTLQTDVLLVGP